jgi:tRNA-2-methylthio-N6-dimethylallyladenosine synthase
MLKTFYIKTYGCAMNISDSNTIRNTLSQYSLKEVNNWKDSDIVILVTCSIRQQSEDKVAGWGNNEHLEILKNKTVVMTGCMAQRYDRVKRSMNNEYEEELKRRFPWITHFLNIKDIKRLPNILGIENNDLVNNENINYNLDNKYQGLFSISHGCNNFCSYCIVPYARGEQIDFDKKDILDNIKSFVKNDGKLVTLLGQNVNSWNFNDENFVDLLREVENIDGEFWINFLSSHPKDISEELIELITTHKKFLKHCHIAVQSGSDRILKLMNRQYTRDRFLDICRKIKAFDPEFRITTDVIVGFPTESEEDFEDTIDLIKECEIDMVYIGKYSPREGSVSYKLEDDVSMDIKKDREKRLKAVVDKIRDRKHKSFVNKDIPVLVTGKNTGLTYYNHNIVLNKKHIEAKIETIKIKTCDRNGLIS